MLHRPFQGQDLMGVYRIIDLEGGGFSLNYESFTKCYNVQQTTGVTFSFLLNEILLNTTMDPLHLLP